MTEKRQSITINFAGVNYRLLVRIQAILALLSLFLLLGAAASLWYARAYRAESAALAGQVSDLAKSQEKLRPVMQEREELAKTLAGMTALLDARRMSWTRLLTGIEEAFPAGIALEKVEFNIKDHTASLEGIANSPEALSSLMIGLQQSQVFTNPLLKRQSMEKGNLAFNVAISYQQPAVVAGPARGQEK
ncbi:MAG: PilN domain-containing protein [Nitrospiraceae bacterium]|nr:PilN domain-containing protein [Nitrospiraceae bacterium]